ncbi:Tn3 family transposase [Paraburkholderia phytofirmans]
MNLRFWLQHNPCLRRSLFIGCTPTCKPSAPTRGSVNLCRTRHMLRFINDFNLRQVVQKALNRGEAYYRLRRAIPYVTSGKLCVHTEAEQQLWNECSRLITNAIIHYNTTLLSRVHDQKRAAGDHAAMELIAGISPVAWQHVNLFGGFEFGPAGRTVDIDALAAYYEDPAY